MLRDENVLTGWKHEYEALVAEMYLCARGALFIGAGSFEDYYQGAVIISYYYLLLLFTTTIYYYQGAVMIYYMCTIRCMI